MSCANDVFTRQQLSLTLRGDTHVSLGRSVSISYKSYLYVMLTMIIRRLNNEL